jgi:hypothetical protein
MPQSLLTCQLQEKPRYRVWCLYSSFVHAVTFFLVVILGSPPEHFKEGQGNAISCSIGPLIDEDISPLPHTQTKFNKGFLYFYSKNLT